MRLAHGVSLLALLAALTPQTAAYSAGDHVPEVRTQIIRDYARITFEWPKDTALKASTKGNQLILRFDRQADPDFAQLLPQLSPYVTKATLTEGGSTLVFTLDRKYRVRSFASGSVNGVDLMGIDPAAKERDAKALQGLADADEPHENAPEPESENDDTETDDHRLKAPAAPVANEAPETPTERATPEDGSTRSRGARISTAAPVQGVQVQNSYEQTPQQQEEAAKIRAAYEAKLAAIGKKTLEDEKKPAAPSARELAATTPSAAGAETSGAEQPKEVTAPAAPAAATPETKPAAPAEPAQPASAPAATEPPAAAAASTQTEAQPKAEAATASAPATAAESTAPAPAVQSAPATTSTATAAPAPSPAPTDAEALAQQEKTGQSATASPETARSDALRIFASTVDGNALLRFPWKERVAAAVFQRGTELWIVFSKPTIIDLEGLKDTAADLYPDIKQFTAENATVLRIKTRLNGGASVARKDSEFEWQVQITNAQQSPKTLLRMDINTEPPLPPHVFLPVSEPSDMLTLQDPDVGDELLVVPSYKAGEGVAPRRRFVDFALLQTATGLVVQKISDDTAITLQRNGLRIGTESGAHLTPGLPTLRPASEDPAEVSAMLAPPPEQQTETTPAEQARQEEKPKAKEPVARNRASGDVLFPYSDWRALTDVPFVDQVQALNTAIAQKGISQEATELRLRLAQLYLSENMAAEALGVLQDIRRRAPEFFIEKRLSALTGGAHFLMHRFQDASQDFSVQELQGSEEVDLWREALAMLLGNPDASIDYLEYNEAFIAKYPPQMRQQLGIIAADSAVAKADYNTALLVLDALKQGKLLDGIDDYAAYLLAKVSVENGKVEEGLTAWGALAQDYTNPLVRARAEYAHANKELELGRITPQQATNRLEKVRLSWRGDDLELAVSAQLGDLYADQNDWRSAMHVWRVLAQSYPNTAAAVEAQNRMKTAFLELFDKGLVATLPPLDQLALYYEYRELAPQGETGERIINTLVDRMVALDLLDQATGVLEQRVRYLLEREDRSRTGMRLARLYLLNHKPEKALQALARSVYGDNPEDVRTERDRISARAFAELGRMEDALVILKDDKTAEAEDIRLNVHWKRKDWPNVIASIEGSLRGRTDTTAPVTLAESEKLVQLAIAYATENDMSQLQYLRDYFTPLMAGNPREPLFAFITRPDIPVTPKTVEQAIAQLEYTRDFLKNYNTRNLSDQIAAATPSVAGGMPAKAQN